MACCGVRSWYLKGQAGKCLLRRWLVNRFALEVTRIRYKETRTREFHFGQSQGQEGKLWRIGEILNMFDI